MTALAPSPVTGERQVITYCRLCEPLCGLIATVVDDRLVSLRPDEDHPLTRGNACPRGLAFGDVQNDPERVLHPLRRRGDGTFEQVSWDVALDDIAARLLAVKTEHGAKSIGHYLGNPAGFNYANSLWHALFMLALGDKTDRAQQYTVGSQDVNCRFVASKLLYNAASQLPFPDLKRTDLLLVLGANPLVSHGSAIRAPRVRESLGAIVKRGGRIVVVDPRRTETAKAFEHVPIRPDGDAWLLLSLLHVLFEEGLDDGQAIAIQSTGIDALRDAVVAYPPEITEVHSGVPADVVRQLARDFAAAPSASAYGRTGSCLGRHGTLVSCLIDALSLVTGNLDRPGGTLFSHAVIPVEDMGERSGSMTYGAFHSRIGGFPDVMGILPAALMAEEIETPGPGQLRALIVNCGNPVLSAPDGARLSAALDELDLLVSLDLYVTETSKHADYILPATTFLEREDYPIALSSSSPTVFIQSTEAVVAPYGEAREEWRVFEELAKRMGVAMFLPARLSRLSFLTKGVTPRRLIGLLLRMGPYGDRFGVRRGGLNQGRLRAQPHGVVLAEHAPTGVLSDAVRHSDRLVHLDHPEIWEELARLGTPEALDTTDFPLRMIGLREPRSQNSWLHNSPTLMKGANRRHQARLHPDDASAAGVGQGERVRIVSRHGEIETEATLTDEMSRGTIAVPHGWGHDGGWSRANAAGGANVNQLMGSAPGDLEVLAGMARLNAVPVRIERAVAGG